MTEEPNSLPQLAGLRVLLLALAVLSVAGCHRDGQILNEATEQWYTWTDDGVRHYILEFGQGPTVVVIHGGWGAEHSYLIEPLTRLSDRFSFVLYDQRGSLRSPAPDSTISLSRLAADLEHLRIQLGRERLVLLTHSMGSRLATAYLKLHPDRLAGLVMTAPVIPSGANVAEAAISESQRRHAAFAMRNDSLQAARAGLSERQWSTMTDREKSARNKISFAAGNIYHVERWHEMKGGGVFFNGHVYPLLVQNTDPALWDGHFSALADARIPIRIIMGDHDLVDFGAVMWPDLADQLPGARLRLVTEAGHNLWIDQPAEWREAVSAALSYVTSWPT